MRTLCALLLSWLSATSCVAAEWFPLQVEVDGRGASYQPLTGASKPWRICALLPHGMDRYWWGVAWGLDEEAQRQGVQLGVYEAGGYQYPDMQRAQLTRCGQLAADAYVIAAISAKGLCDEIALLHRDKVPVVDLINRIDCPGITARSQVDFADMNAFITGIGIVTGKLDRNTAILVGDDKRTDAAPKRFSTLWRHHCLGKVRFSRCHPASP